MLLNKLNYILTQEIIPPETFLLNWPNREHCCMEAIFHGARNSRGRLFSEMRQEMVQPEVVKILVLYVQPPSHSAKRQSGSGQLNLPYNENATRSRFSAYFTFVS